MTKVYIMDWGYNLCDSYIIRGRYNFVTTKNPETLHEWMACPVWGVLIDTGSHKVLFDLGCLPDGMAGGWPQWIRETNPWFHTEEQTVPGQLAKLGLTPEDIDTVVVSHTHIDHFGNIGLFTHADVYVPKEDWINALVTMHRTSDEAQYGQCLPAELNVRVKAFHPVAKGEDFELFPGIHIITLPGHTLNLLGIIVHLENSGNIIFTSDSVYLLDSLKKPIKPCGSVTDSIGYLESLNKILRLRDKHGAAIIPGHDMALFRSLKKTPEYYD